MNPERRSLGAVDVELIDAGAPGLEPAGVIFIFGTRLEAPAALAAGLYRDGLAPLVVVTGGALRQPDGLVEADRHGALLLDYGVPEEAIVVENKSGSTTENVLFALPLLEARCERVDSVIAVVKWYHRRALVTLAQHIPTLSRICVKDYEPIDPPTGQPISRSNWAARADRLERETTYMRELVSNGTDPLVRDSPGWRRTL